MSHGDGFTAMSHESHGQCWCAVGAHCGFLDCDPWEGNDQHAQ